MSKVNLTYTKGISVSASPSVFAFGAQGGVSIDTKGNVAIQGTFSTGLTGGSPGAAVTSFNTITNAPNIDSLNGMSYQIGASGGTVIEGVPIVAIADFNLIPGQTNNDLYYGGTVGAGFGTPGIEGHVTMSNTVTWDETKFNVFDVAEKIEKQ